MDRRSFLKCSGKACAGIGLGLALNSMLLQSCGAGLSVLKLEQQSGRVAVPMTQFVTSNFLMLRVKDFPFDIGVQRNDDNTYLALVLMCPHANQPLTKAGSGYICTLHGSRFAKNGDLLKGPSTLPLYELPIQEEDGFLNILTEKFRAQIQ